MELTEPRPKKHCKLPTNLPLPVIYRKDGNLKKFSAHFNGFSVILDNLDDMKTIVSMGYFGKANFSRSYPQFTQNQPKIIRQRQFVTRKQFTGNQPNKVITVPDSDSENDDYFTNLQPKYEIDCSGLSETVWLSLEEAFFLASAVKCLDVSCSDGKLLDCDQLWALFQETDSFFVRNYVVYFYYRAKNWVVKPGIKFGGDFMLYKQGPPFYHSSYIIIIEVIDSINGERNSILTNRCMDNRSVLGLNRLCETAGKELVICRVKWPNNQISYENFSNIEIQEILVKRWIASHHQEQEVI
ncbi:unnamed protein product [Ceutorhynchus assimilis]|uniref:tRNA-splicing endonuclease subunit Sen2 n=1 Tax=Ceutorhynchus assimilis TaxID=467358 RepID=A0A9N9MIY8_9CUCU|nr:unnamed protein product [Ceutorhynchus assimilis]